MKYLCGRETELLFIATKRKRVEQTLIPGNHERVNRIKIATTKHWT